MRRLLALSALVLALPLVLPASDFDWMVREFSRETGAHQIHIPFIGLVRFSVAVVHPAGTSELRLAVFEHTDLELSRFSELTDAVVGYQWKPLVRARSRNKESTNIYAQQTGSDLRLLVTSFEGGEATFVQVRIKPEQLMKFLDDHGDSRH